MTPPRPRSVTNVYLRRHEVSTSREPFVSLFLWTVVAAAGVGSVCDEATISLYRRFLVTLSLVDDEATTSPLRLRRLREVYAKKFGEPLAYAAELMQRECKQRGISSFLLGISSQRDLWPISLASNLQVSAQRALPCGRRRLTPRRRQDHSLLSRPRGRAAPSSAETWFCDASLENSRYASADDLAVDMVRQVLADAELA